MKRFLSRLFSHPVPFCPRIAKSETGRVTASSLEMLESRIAPAAVAVFSKGTLLIQGDPDGDLVIEQTKAEGSDVITTVITENSAPLAGTSSFDGVKNIVVKLDPRATDQNQVNMKLIRVPGSVEVLAPKAASTNVQIIGLAPVGDLPQIGKSILFKGGAGEESISIFAIEVGGGFVFPAGKSAASAYIAGNVSIGSNVSFIGANSVTIDPGAQIHGNLLITQKAALPEEHFILGAGAKIDGNVVIFAGPGGTTINAYAEVGGRFFANAGQGANSFNVSLIAKSLQYVSGNSLDSVSLLKSEISTFATFILGGGENTVLFNIGPFGLLGDFSVGKNLSIGGGKDKDIYRLDSATNNVIVGGKTVVALGGGDNVLMWDGSSTGSAINIAAGGGADFVRLVGLEASNSALSVNLGGGNDRLSLGSTFLRASLNGGSGNDEILAGSVFPDKTTRKGFEVGV